MSDGSKQSGVSGTLKGLVLVVGLGLAYLVQKFTGIDILSKLNKTQEPSGQTSIEAPADKTLKSADPKDTLAKAPVKENQPAPTPAPTKTETPKAATPDAPPNTGDTGSKKTAPKTPPAAKQDNGVETVRQLFKAQRSSVWVKTEGKVAHLLPDDNFEPRHQNFLLELAPDLTVKVSHNIDDAPYLTGLKKGDALVLQGRYEFNEKGGVIHFTHKADNPTKDKPGGWIEFNGKRYQ